VGSKVTSSPFNSIFGGSIGIPIKSSGTLGISG
jgi:hypothetical protein